MIINIPDNWLPTSENINALPRPLRDFIMRLHANTDPAGELRRAMVAEMERDALRKMIEEAPEVEVTKWVEGAPNKGSLWARIELQDDYDRLHGAKRFKLLEVE